MPGIDDTAGNKKDKIPALWSLGSRRETYKQI